MTRNTTRLADFMLARIAEEEAVIAGAPQAPRHQRIDVRALANCHARRAIVMICSAEDATLRCRVILSRLALPYAEHPDYPLPGELPTTCWPDGPSQGQRIALLRAS